MKKENSPQSLAKEKALSMREKIESKRPRFRQQESWRYKRIKECWRKPFGIDSKMRKRKKGWPKSVEVGYRGPKATRGLHPSGYAEVFVRTVDDVDKVDAKMQAIRIDHAVGAKKRVEILERARKKGAFVLNSREVKESKEKEEHKEGEKEEKPK